MNEELKEINLMSFTMDYETNEIVGRCKLSEDEYANIRLCEKDIKSMSSWFDLAKHMKSNKTEEE